MKEIIINNIEKNSIASEMGVQAGDKLLKINDIVPKDIIDYKYLLADENLIIEIEKNDGEIWELEIEKDYNEDIGLIFNSGIIDEPKNCQNKCIFCFIDQLPKGMRKSLYFKDDDTRLSFIQGNYVTLTNLKEDDIERIIKYRIQPINISIHTTNPDLRYKMLNNKRASKVNEIITRLADNGIIMNTQIVLCPEVNDKEELDRTMTDLSKLYPYINSISIVPVGLTKYRDKLFPLRKFSKEEAQSVISQIKRVQEYMIKKHGSRFVFPSDEFFILSEYSIPEHEYYEGFKQLENGIGMLSLFINQVNESFLHVDGQIKTRKISIATGKLVYPFIKNIAINVMKKFPQINIKVFEIENNFFGKGITVSGLLTGTDIVDQLKGKDLGEELIISKNMLKRDEDIFLDDFTVADIQNQLGIRVMPVETDGKLFINKILGRV